MYIQVVLTKHGFGQHGFGQHSFRSYTIYDLWSKTSLSNTDFRRPYTVCFSKCSKSYWSQVHSRNAVIALLKFHGNRKNTSFSFCYLRTCAIFFLHTQQVGTFLTKNIWLALPFKDHLKRPFSATQPLSLENQDDASIHFYIVS